MRERSENFWLHTLCNWYRLHFCYGWSDVHSSRSTVFDLLPGFAGETPDSHFLVPVLLLGFSWSPAGWSSSLDRPPHPRIICHQCRSLKLSSAHKTLPHFFSVVKASCLTPSTCPVFRFVCEFYLRSFLVSSDTHLDSLQLNSNLAPATSASRPDPDQYPPASVIK